MDVDPVDSSSLQSSSQPRKVAVASSSSSSSSAPLARPSKVHGPDSLPIAPARDALVSYIRSHSTVILVGETGSGKTTQLPQFLFRAGLVGSESGRRIAVTQPRVLAATSVARRVAQEMHTTVGDLVGYNVRFDNKTSASTAIHYLTDGMLLREAILDPLLKEYAVIVLDEAHERTLNTDLLCSLVKRAQQARASMSRQKQLRVVVMSATLESSKFADFFQAETLYLEGRSFPVQMLYLAEGPTDADSHTTAGSARSSARSSSTFSSSSNSLNSSTSLNSSNSLNSSSKIAQSGHNNTRTALNSGPSASSGVSSSLSSSSGKPAQSSAGGSGGGTNRNAVTASSSSNATTGASSTQQQQPDYWGSAKKLTDALGLQLASPTDDASVLAGVAVMQIHIEQQPGDILVFLTGADEITSVERTLNAKNRLLNDDHQMLVITLFAALQPEQQQRAFEPPPAGKRKVILATNIAESSITIPNIRYVVDTGLAKIRLYDPDTGVSKLVVTRISKAAAQQRAGRAGRDSPGVCLRLYTQATFAKMSDNLVPEICRIPLSDALLTLHSIGIAQPYELSYLDKPPLRSVKSGAVELLLLGALTADNQITPLGQSMAVLPIEPAKARVLISSVEFSCTKEMLTILAMISVEQVFIEPHGELKANAERARAALIVPNSDHLTVLRVYDEFVGVPSSKRKHWCTERCLSYRDLIKAKQVREQLENYLQQKDIPHTSTCNGDIKPIQYVQFVDFPVVNVKRCLLTGYCTHVAELQPDFKYITSFPRQEVKIHARSVVSRQHPLPMLVVYEDLVVASERTCMQVVTEVDRSDVTAFNQSWLQENRGLLRQH